MLDLTQCRSRQIVGEDNLVRHFEAGELRLHMCRQRLLLNLSPRTPNHIGYRHLAPTRIWPSDDRAFRDIWVLQEYTLHFRRINVLSAGNNQIRLSVMDPKISVSIAMSEVARSVPTIAQRLARCLSIAPVFAEHIRSSHRDLAWGSCRQSVASIVDDCLSRAVENCPLCVTRNCPSSNS